MKYTPSTRIQSVVKEELKSYFNTGAVDDTLFDYWTAYAVSKFKGTSKPTKEVYLPINNYKVELPRDYQEAKEVWACGVISSENLQDFTSTYYLTDCRVTRINNKCHECFDNKCQECVNIPQKYQVLNKRTGSTLLEYKKSYLLIPYKSSGSPCSPEDPRIYKVDGCTLTTNLQKGSVHIIYQTDNVEEDTGNILIPDVPEVEEYVGKYLRYKIFDMLSNSVVDESLRAVLQKLDRSERELAEAFVTAETELKKQTKYQVANLIKGRRRRFNNYRSMMR